MEIVNGYVCFDCGDVARAKRNQDPSVAPGRPPRLDVTADAAGSGAASVSTAANQPLATGFRGTRVNLLL